VLAYTDAMDALSRRVLPVCALALDLSPHAFDAAFAESCACGSSGERRAGLGA